MAPKKHWRRLGELAIARRVELGYPRRAAFARAKGFTNDRTLAALENAERTNFDPTTLLQFEHAYEWAPGSIRAVLAGGDPTPAGTPKPPEPIDEYDRWIDTLLATDLPDHVKEGLIAVLDIQREQERRARTAM